MGNVFECTNVLWADRATCLMLSWQHKLVSPPTEQETDRGTEREKETLTRSLAYFQAIGHTCILTHTHTHKQNMVYATLSFSLSLLSHYFCSLALAISNFSLSHCPCFLAVSLSLLFSLLLSLALSCSLSHCQCFLSFCLLLSHSVSRSLTLSRSPSLLLSHTLYAFSLSLSHGLCFLFLAVF